MFRGANRKKWLKKKTKNFSFFYEGKKQMKTEYRIKDT